MPGDRIPAWLRDLLLALAGAGLAWAGASLVPALEATDRPWAPLAAAALVVIVQALNPWARRYGLTLPSGAATEAEEHPGHPDSGQP
jgi:hypothetical protein